MNRLRTAVKRGAQRMVAAWFPGALVVRLPGTAGRSVNLTFDDGPHPEHTPRILDTLAEHDVRATFFVSGADAETYPQLVRDVAAAGHEIANHGYSHFSPDEVDEEHYLADVERAQAVLEQILGARIPRFFRPPYGRLTPRLWWRLRQRGYCCVLWSVDSCDSGATEPADVVRQTVRAGLAPGAIVLLHEDYDWSVAALPQLIACIRSRKLGFVTLGPAAPVGAVPDSERVVPSARGEDLVA